MMNFYTSGIYKYLLKTNEQRHSKIPNELKMSNLSGVGALCGLILGKASIFDELEIELHKQQINYTQIPPVTRQRMSYDVIEEFFGADVRDEENCKVCNRFLFRERKNAFVYERVLNELTQYFLVNEKSPVEGFVHLYRALEFMSYSFPLIYAEKSKDYRGSFKTLKSFINGNGSGELKFFETFLRTLFENDRIYSMEMEVYMDTTKIHELENEFSKIINQSIYEFDNMTLKFKFEHIITIFITIRNRYLHMLVGQGDENFFDITYDKNDVFKSLNPVFINWISIIIKKIVQHGVLSTNV